MCHLLTPSWPNFLPCSSPEFFLPPGCPPFYSTLSSRQWVLFHWHVIHPSIQHASIFSILLFTFFVDCSKESRVSWGYHLVVVHSLQVSVSVNREKSAEAIHGLVFYVIKKIVSLGMLSWDRLMLSNTYSIIFTSLWVDSACYTCHQYCILY